MQPVNCPSPATKPLSRWLTAASLALAVCTVAVVVSAESNDRVAAVHRIYKGQTLGMIAKRYRVSVAAICNANSISQRHRIKPGDKLVIPALGDEDGSQARAQSATLLAGGKPVATAATKPPAPKADKQAARSATGAVGKTQNHTVYRGQTLTMIAKRYNVSVDAIVHANAIENARAIKPGEKLTIPARDDKDGSRARAMLAKLPESKTAAATLSKPKQATPPKPTRAGSPRVHEVGAGHTLSKIALRYKVSVDALCSANGITRSTPIRPGQELVVPAPDDEDGQRARTWWKKEQRAHNAGKPADRSWRDYKKSAWRRGYITLESPNGDKRWTGYVIGPGNKLLPLAREKVTDVLASWRTGKTKRIDSRLVKMIAQVSDVFGGRRIRVVSGYREHSHSSRSRHPEGKALDFSIHGVPNWAIRDYLREQPRLGVGFYPNSSFVHLDVRSKASYWVDMSAPGEAPRYTQKSTSK
jgi:LysM repeat protein